MEAVLDRNSFLLKCSPRVSGKAQAPRSSLTTDKAGSLLGAAAGDLRSRGRSCPDGPAAAGSGFWGGGSRVIRNPEGLVGDSGGGRIFLEHGL